jgi:hypothetical protein
VRYIGNVAEKFNASRVDLVEEASLDAAGSEMVRQRGQQVGAENLQLLPGGQVGVGNQGELARQRRSRAECQASAHRDAKIVLMLSLVKRSNRHSTNVQACSRIGLSFADDERAALPRVETEAKSSRDHQHGIQSWLEVSRARADQ